MTKLYKLIDAQSQTCDGTQRAPASNISIPCSSGQILREWLMKTGRGVYLARPRLFDTLLNCLAFYLINKEVSE